MALRQRRYRGWAVAAAVLFLVGSAVYSHWHAKPDPSSAESAGDTHVDRVIDGDTIVVSGPGMTNEHLRLRGVDAPEVKHPGLNQDAYFGPESRSYLTSRLAGKTVILKFDGTEKRDRYQRLLAYVYLGDGDCVNLDLVRDGMAYVDRRFKTVLQGQFDQLETTARNKRVGLWAGVKDADEPAWRQKWLAKKGLDPAD